MKEINHSEVEAEIRTFLDIKTKEFLEQVKYSEKVGHYKNAPANWSFIDEFVEWLIGDLEMSNTARTIRDELRYEDTPMEIDDDDIPF